MSKYIKEIVESIKNNPTHWRRHGEEGLVRGDIIISKCGNAQWWLGWYGTSIVEVTIKGKDTGQFLSWGDKAKIERAFNRWLRKADLKLMHT